MCGRVQVRVMMDWGRGWYWTLEPLFNVRDRPRAAREGVEYLGGFANELQYTQMNYK